MPDNVGQTPHLEHGEYLCREDVDAAVDEGGDIAAGFLHKMENGVRGLVLHDAPVVHRLLASGLNTIWLIISSVSI